jgi:hypothetical protein
MLNETTMAPACGTNTGLYLMPQQDPSRLLSLKFCTANGCSQRYPVTITIAHSWLDLDSDLQRLNWSSVDFQPI